MKAVLLKEPGGPEQLYLGDAPLPECEENEIMVKVKATAINRADTAQRRGMYPPPPGASSILGLEMAGEVESVGAKVKKWTKGDRVFALLPGGGYAEFVAVPEEMAMPVPENLSFEEGAGIAETYLTTYQSLIWLGELHPREKVLIHAGASGVGTAAIQTAKVEQCTVMTTAGSEAKLRVCRELGADLAVNYRDSGFAEAVLEATRGHGADVIIDFVGEPHFRQNLSCIAQDGRLVFLAMLGGAQVESFELGLLMRKRIKLMGSTLRNRPIDYKISLTREFAQSYLSKFETGELKVVIDRVLPLEEVAAAHTAIEANENIGKIILTV